MVKGEALLFLAGHFFSLKLFYSASWICHNDDGSNVLINSVLFLQEALFNRRWRRLKDCADFWSQITRINWFRRFYFITDDTDYVIAQIFISTISL